LFASPCPIANEERRRFNQYYFIRDIFHIIRIVGIIVLSTTKSCGSLRVCNLFFKNIFGSGFDDCFSCDSAWSVVPSGGDVLQNSANFLLADTPLDGGSVSVVDGKETVMILITLMWWWWWRWWQLQ
jgi:hypothetical protein